MKKLVLTLVLMFSALFAEPTFDQIQNLIDKQEFNISSSKRWIR